MRGTEETCSLLKSVMGPWELHKTLWHMFYIFQNKMIYIYIYAHIYIYIYTHTHIFSAEFCSGSADTEKPNMTGVLRKRWRFSKGPGQRAERDCRGQQVQMLPHSRISATSRNITLKQGQGVPPTCVSSVGVVGLNLTENPATA